MNGKNQDKKIIKEDERTRGKDKSYNNNKNDNIQ